MKIIVLLLFSIISFGQISNPNTANEKSTIKESFDGSKNFLGEDYLGYKGQELYFKLVAKNKGRYVDDNFLDKNKKQLFNLKYEYFAGKYFLIEDIIESLNGNKEVLLKLKNKYSDEILFFKYDVKYESNFPFLVVKYYEAQKAFFVNKEVLIRDFSKLIVSNQKIIAIESGEKISIEKDQYLKCIDLIIDEKYFDLVLLLQNNKGQKFTFPLYDRDLNYKSILTKDEAEEFRLQFGNKNWKIILSQNIKIGFTEKMVEVSWGKPIKINRSSDVDQWLYNGNYLYFSNGKLKFLN